MKRLLLGSLLSCMVIGRLFAAASSSSSEPQHPSMRQLLINDWIDKKIIAKGGKIKPTYIFNAASPLPLYEASEADIFLRDENKTYINLAVQELKNELQQRFGEDSSLLSLIDIHEQELLREWNARIHNRDGVRYFFLDVSTVSMIDKADFCDRTPPQSNPNYTEKDFRKAEEYFWHNRAAEMREIDTIAQDMSAGFSERRRQNLTAIAESIKARSNRVADGYPITLAGDSMVKQAFLISGAFVVHKGFKDSDARAMVALGVLSLVSQRLRAYRYTGYLDFTETERTVGTAQYATDALLSAAAGAAIGASCIAGDLLLRKALPIVSKMLKEGMSNLY